MSIPAHLYYNYWDTLLAIRAGVLHASVFWQQDGEPVYTHDPTNTEHTLPCPILVWQVDDDVVYHTPIAPCKQNEKDEWAYVLVDGKPVFYGEEPTSEEFVNMCAKFIKQKMKQENR